MYEKRVIDKERIRRISGSFSWVDHRFINEGFIRDLDSTEILLYLFLVTVGDRYGLSFYRDDTICQLLKIDKPSLCRARKELILASLIAYEDGIYQVLELPSGIFTDTIHSSRKGISKAGDVLREILREEV